MEICAVGAVAHQRRTNLVQIQSQIRCGLQLTMLCGPLTHLGSPTAVSASSVPQMNWWLWSQVPALSAAVTTGCSKTNIQHSGWFQGSPGDVCWVPTSQSLGYATAGPAGHTITAE